MKEKRFALLIPSILGDLAHDIAVPTPERKCFNEKDINLNYQFTQDGVQRETVHCVMERPQMIKYHSSYSLNFYFLPPSHYSPDSLVGFYHVDESGPPSGYHPMQLFIMTKHSLSFFFLCCILHA